MPDVILRTPRLDLIAATLEHVEAELTARVDLERLLEASVPEDWPPGEYDRGAQEFFRAQLASRGASLIGWLTWYAVTRNSQGGRESLVAGAGFLGPPANGAVEIGYSVIPTARRRGYATEIVKALVAHAFAHPEVNVVVAHTCEENVESTHVLLHCGFSRVGPGPEPGSAEYRAKRTP
jgi:RimJ/RimL family protein N-acetyltransferase